MSNSTAPPPASSNNATSPVPPPPSAPPPSAPPPASPPPSPPPSAPPPASPPPSPPLAPPPAAPPTVASPPPVATAPPPAATSSPPPPPSAPPPATPSPPPPSAPPPANATTPVTPSSSPPPPPVASAPPPAGSPPASPPPPPTLAPPGVAYPPPVQASPPPPVLLGSPPPPAISGVDPVATISSSIKSSNTALIAGVSAGGGVLVLFLAVLAYCCFMKKRKRGEDGLPFAAAGAAHNAYKTDGRYRVDPYAPSADTPYVGVPKAPSGFGDGVPLPPQGNRSAGNSRSWFTYDELQTATDGFAAANLLGEGGFGRVYKGHLPSGQLVAVKQLTVGGGQGDREFRAEVEIISRVHHRHLVSLVGYCIADSQRLLVYDYVPNGTLDVNLNGAGKPVMSWETRQRVALGSARGLAYLHEDCHPRIIHRDIKSSNILLDDKYEAQVADFGLAKLASDTNTHVSTRVMGTFGYLAPEYAQSGKLTEKSDVYSFGVVLLELITGRKPVDTRQPIGEESLVEWTRPLMTLALEDGDLEDLVDPRLGHDYDPKEMFRMVEAAASCVRHSASKRPKMGQVVRALESDAENGGLYQGMKPGHSTDHDSDFGGSRFGGSDYDTQQYNADMVRAKKLALGSQAFGSEYSSATSEYGANPSASSEFERAKDMGSDFSSGEAQIDNRNQVPTSVRTINKNNRSSIPTGRSRMNPKFSGSPLQGVGPQRPGQRSQESPVSGQSRSAGSDTFSPSRPPPLPQYDAEYTPIDYTSSAKTKQVAEPFGEGR